MHNALQPAVNVEKQHCADHAPDIRLYISMSKYMLVYAVSYTVTTLYFESGLTGLATLTGLCPTLFSCIACIGLPHCSLLDCQPYQAGLFAPKLPQDILY
jgi:hypothetical protein